MGHLKRRLPDALSISRIPASLAFLLVFSSHAHNWFWVAMALAAYALLSDVLDGFLARRWNVTSDRGYYLDGLGDKSFTVAIGLVVAREAPVLTWLMWGLIFREIALYSLRVIDPSRIENQAGLRLYSLVHAGFIRVCFGLFFAQTYLELAESTFRIPTSTLGIGFGITLLIGLVPITALMRSIFSSPP